MSLHRHRMHSAPARPTGAPALENAMSTTSNNSFKVAKSNVATPPPLHPLLVHPIARPHSTPPLPYRASS